MRESSKRIAIIGGGMVGTTLALLLAQQGVSSTIIESKKLSNTLKKSDSDVLDLRSTALSKLTCSLFDRLGLWHNKLNKTGSDIQHVHVSSKGRFGATRLSASSQGLDCLGHVVPNEALTTILYEAISDNPLIEMLSGVRTRKIIKQRDSEWLIDLDSGVQIEAPFLVISDGAKSASAQSLGIDYEVFDYGQSALIANVEVEQGHQARAYERFLEQGAMALLPLSDKHCSLIWVGSHQAAETLKIAPAQKQITVFNESFGDRLGAFKKIGETIQYPLSRCCSKELSRPGLAVCGNAAHTIHPIAGQGFNLAIRGIERLANALVSGPNCNAAGQIYEQQHRADVEFTVKMLDVMLQAFHRNHLGLSNLSQLGLIGLDNLPALKNQFTRVAMGSRSDNAALQRTF